MSNFFIKMDGEGQQMENGEGQQMENGEGQQMEKW